jgi:hypothetical protein
MVVLNGSVAAAGFRPLNAALERPVLAPAGTSATARGQTFVVGVDAKIPFLGDAVGPRLAERLRGDGLSYLSDVERNRAVAACVDA